MPRVSVSQLKFIRFFNFSSAILKPKTKPDEIPTPADWRKGDSDSLNTGPLSLATPQMPALAYFVRRSLHKSDRSED